MPKPLHLMILTSHAHEAEGLVTALRNGGLPAHGTYTHHPERLIGLLAERPCDLILCCVYDPKIDLQSALMHHKALGQDVPLLLIADDQTPPEVLIQAMRSGARDLTERGDFEHLQLVVAREWSDLQKRRALAEAREQLEHCERRARDQAEDSTETGAFIQQGIHISANRAYRTLFGFAQPEDLEGYPILDLIAPEHRSKIRAFLQELDAGGRGATGPLDLVCLRTDGSRFDAQLAATHAEIDGEPALRITLHPKGTGGGGSAGGGSVDADTGLPSRAALMQRLSEHLAAAGSGPLALIVLRIEGLEHVALSDGPSAAFRLAAEVAASLRGAIPEGGLLGRLGDGAFALVVQPAMPEQARAIAEELRRLGLRALGQRHGGATRTGLAVGVALADSAERSPIALVDRAYRDGAAAPLGHPVPPPALPASEPTRATPISPAPPSTPREAAPSQAAAPPTPAAKPQAMADTAGRGPDPDAMAALVAEALGGTGPAKLQLVYQPIVSLMGDSQENYSVLVRLLDGDQRPYEAKQFLGTLAAGPMGEIDRWVIEHAIAELVSQRAKGHRLNFFINVAEASVQDEELIVWLCDRLRDLDGQGNWLTFQFPEDEARRNLHALARLAEGLKKIKCRIALNRCGQGKDQQMLMQSLPLDFVLFTHDLASGLAKDKAKQERLVALADLAREHSVKSVVTGVDDTQTLTVLWTAGIDYVQGNFLQRPSPSIEVQGPG